MLDNDNPLWVEKYRPKTINDVILPEHMKKSFETFIVNKTLPNLLLSGSPGVGKTTVAKAILEQLGCEYMVINGSLEGRLIDTLRSQIADYASSISLYGGRKYIIIDEADYLNQNSVQPAFRNLMEELSANCGFIFTCNYKGRIIAPLQSRLASIDFKILKEDKPKIASQIMKRLIYILDTESITYEKEAVAGMIKRYMPDWRRIINELQRYSTINGTIDSGILAQSEYVNAESLIAMLKDKDFTSARKWIGENTDASFDDLFTQLYLVGIDKVTKESIPNWISILGEYQYRLAFVTNPEITVSSMILQLMANCIFK